MATLRKVFGSSIGTKFLIGVTGLGLVVYLVLHLAGNILYFFGPEVFNSYSHALISNPLIVPIEIGLAAIFVAHIYKTVRMWMDNQRARPVRYAEKRSAGHTSRKGLSSSTMIFTGLATLAFVVIHLKQFKYGAYYLVADTDIRDLYRLETEVFSSPIWVAVYVFGMVLIGFHLRHGIASAFQSLGLEHPRYTRRILVTGLVLAIVLAGGLGVIPVWVYFTR
jgi:succinate dehydrogenase / fumarate reductase cytochrome b subunit